MQQPLGLSTYRWNNNIKSMLLLGAFPLLLLGLLWAFFFILGWAETTPQNHLSPWVFAEEGFLIFWPYALGLASIWLVIGSFFNERLIRFSTHAQPILRKEYPEIYNLLENLCISRGLAVPKLFIIDTTVMNAYASGLGEKSFAITLTRGLIKNLNKNEIEAVIAHELSHIINRDVRLLVTTVLFGGMLSFFAELLWRNMHYSSRESKKGTGAALLIAAILLSVGYLISLLLRFALSRKREYLADAGAVSLTKQPEHMISALEKISGHAAMPEAPSGVQAMMIENPPGIFDLFDTHPPIEKRIAVLQHLSGRPAKNASIIPQIHKR